jgi:phosphoribosyl-AMP cyclohydrolase
MIDKLTPRYNEQGLIPVVVQDVTSRAILMLAWMNAVAFELTLSTKQVHFWSRSRQELWLKGATSGNLLSLVEIRIDCDEDTLLVLVHPAGPACHTGQTSCFFRTLFSESDPGCNP